ncbi:MAG: hypothetical protein IT427_02225 [Pirellulales bacterium]|nr:hypothetical protein [Pirellulales bacterium]
MATKLTLLAACLSLESVQLAAAEAKSAADSVDAQKAADNPAAQTADPLPAKVDLRPELEKYGLGPRQQGKRSTCSVFTTAAAYEFALAKHRGRGEPLSVEYLNWASNQLLGRNEDLGQFFHHLVRAIGKYGACPEADMPYRQKFDPAFAPSDDAKKHAHEFGDLGFQVHWIKRFHPERLSDEQFLEIKKTLARGFPVAAGASHSRLFVGYRDDPAKDGGGIFLTKDSGAGRFAEVTYEFAKKEVNDAYWVNIPVEK